MGEGAGYRCQCWKLIQVGFIGSGMGYVFSVGYGFRFGGRVEVWGMGTGVVYGYRPWYGYRS